MPGSTNAPRGSLRGFRWRFFALGIALFGLHLPAASATASPNSCNPEHARCLAGFTILCDKGGGVPENVPGADAVAADGGAKYRCALTSPVPVGALTTLSVTIRWPGLPPVVLDVLEDAIVRDAISKPSLSFQFSVPDVPGANAIYRTRVELLFSVGDQVTKDASSLAYILALDRLGLMAAETLIPGQSVSLIAMGPSSTVLDVEGLRCQNPADTEAAPMILSLTAKGSGDAGARVWKAAAPQTPVGAPPLRCELQGRLDGWALEIPLTLAFKRPLERNHLWVDRAFVSPGDTLRVFAFESDPGTASLIPREGLEVEGRWSKLPSKKRAKATRARISSDGAAKLEVAKTKFHARAQFDLGWEGVGGGVEQPVVALGAVMAGRLQTRFPLLFEPPYVSTGGAVNVEITALQFDGPIPANKEFDSGFYWGGAGWIPSILVEQMATPGDGVWKQTYAFKKFLLWTLSEMRVTRGVGVVVGQHDLGISPSSWATVTYGPKPL